MNYNLKVLITKADKTQRTKLKKYLCGLGFKNVIDVSDGASAIDIAESFMPDVVVTDIWLEKINGIRLVKNIREMCKNTSFVIWTSVENEVICRAMVSGTIDKYVLSECSFEDIAKAILEVHFDVQRKKEEERFKILRSSECDSKTLMEIYISEILQSFGMSVSMKGYKYTRYAIITALTFELENYNLTKVIYPQTACFFKTTPSRVERDIRHSIQSVFAKGNRKAIEKYFPCALSDELYRPTNGEFIAVMCDRVRMELKNVKFSYNAESTKQSDFPALSAGGDKR